MIKNPELWKEYEETNTDSYSKCCVDIARIVMKLLDDNHLPLRNGYFPDIQTAHGLICIANRQLKAGLSGFMAGCVATMVAKCHSRGEEFKRSHNQDVGEEPITTGVINHALINLS